MKDAELGETREEIEKRKEEYRRQREQVQAQAEEELPEEMQPEEPQTYVVQRGDSLSQIAQKVYGDASRWREILKANEDQIKDPKVILPGQELRIP